MVDGCKSLLEVITCGVPQGSVLGPLLFLIYINDLPNCSDFLSWLFADDAALVMSAKTLIDLEENMNREAKKLNDWLLANKLTIHYTNKTTYMLINYKKKQRLQDFKFFIGDHLIEQCTSYKYLGVIIDNKLNWKEQIDAVAKKITGVVGVLYKTRRNLNRKTMKIVYNSLVESHIRYGILGWGTSCKSYIRKLEVAQNKALRCITYSDRRTRLRPLYKTNNILPVDDIYNIECLKFMFNFKHKKLPLAFNDYFTLRSELSNVTRNDRQREQFKTKRSQASIKFIGPRKWSEIPRAARQITSTKTFIHQVKATLIQDLTSP